MTSATEKHYHVLLVSPPSGSQTDAHANLDPGFWKTPVDIDDADLTLDGKPLNLLHEENQNRWMVEHHVFESRDEDDMRGRRRDRMGEVSNHISFLS